MRWAIWSGVRSSMWVEMDHWLPWGAVMRYRRSPQNWSAGTATAACSRGVTLPPRMALRGPV